MTGGGVLRVVAPHATRTGSTQVLLDLLGELKPYLDAPPEVDLLSGGPLRGALESMGRPPSPAARPDVVLVNTSLAADEVLRVPRGVATVVYVHEAAEALSTLPATAIEGLRQADRVLCVSTAIRSDVVGAGVDPARAVVVPPLVVPRAVPDPEVVAEARLRLAGTDRPLLVGCGEASWRKGADLFVEVVRRVSVERPVTAAWIGRRLRPFSATLDHDAVAAGLSDELHWVGEVDDPAPLIAAADILVVPSRVDPQPLVPLEAGAVGTATVGFATGGLSEVAAAGGALAVDYPDTTELASAVVGLLDDAAGRSALAAGAVRWTIERQSAAAVVPLVVSVLAEVTNRS